MSRSRSPRTTLWRLLLAGPTVLFACLAYSWLTLPDVRELRSENPNRTAFMDLRRDEANRESRAAREIRRWVPYGRISSSLRQAVLVAEDAGFWGHDGVDYGELRAALSLTLRDGRPLRGASTITQQLAKNLYLSPSRNPYRKVVELLITRRLEAELPKTRILELYLNVVEWGDGIWGAEAAARAYFGRPAADLSASQAALLAGALINARVYSPAAPNRRLIARQRIILNRMNRPATVSQPARVLESDIDEEPPAAETLAEEPVLPAPTDRAEPSQEAPPAEAPPASATN